MRTRTVVYTVRRQWGKVIVAVFLGMVAGLCFGISFAKGDTALAQFGVGLLILSGVFLYKGIVSTHHHPHPTSSTR